MRRTKPEPREVPADVRYNSVPVSFFINRIMKRGKKSVATTIVYDALDIVKEKTGKAPIEVMLNIARTIRSITRRKRKPVVLPSTLPMSSTKRINGTMPTWICRDIVTTSKTWLGQDRPRFGLCSGRCRYQGC